MNEIAPMSVSERVARQWHEGSDHAAYEPFGGPLCNCWQVAGRIMPMLRDARDEGWNAYADAIDLSDPNEYPNPDQHPNPYEEDRHVDQ